jgi:hypothetical protein
MRLVDASAAPAFVLAEEIHDSDRAARAAVSALEAYWRVGTYEAVQSTDFRARLQRADRYAAEGTRERTLTEVSLGLSSIALTGPVSGHPYLRRAAEAAIATSDNSAFFVAAGPVLRNLSSVRDRPIVHRLADEAIRRPRNVARSDSLALSLYCLGGVMLERGERAQAEEQWAQLSAIADRTRDNLARLASIQSRLVLAYYDGQLDVALEMDSEVERITAETGTSAPTTGVFAVPIYSLVLLGRAPEALDRSSGYPRSDMAFKAWTLAQLGRNEEAWELRSRFGDLTSESDETHMVYLGLLLESATLGGDKDFVVALRKRLMPMGQYCCAGLWGISWNRVLGASAALIGEHEGARAHYLLAIEQCMKIGLRPELALSHLGLSELLLDPSAQPNPKGTREDDEDEAMRHLDIAIAELGDMKMQPALERALRHKEVLKA